MKTIICILLVFCVVSCGEDVTVVKKAEKVPQADSVILFRKSDSIIELFEKNDYAGLEKWSKDVKIHFSPYPFVDSTDFELRLKASQLASAYKSGVALMWGNYDGSGEEILLSVREYMSEFVTDADYRTEGERSYSRLPNTGNSVSNIQSAFPGSEFTSYYINGKNPEYAGMDWKSLTLVFQKSEGDWVLVGVVHGQWTI